MTMTIVPYVTPFNIKIKGPQPNNVTSTCYLKCYSDASSQMTQDELAAPWDKAFALNETAAGGCPVALHPF